MKVLKYNKTYKDQVLELLNLNTPEYFAPEERDDLIYYLNNFTDNYFVIEDEENTILLGCGGYNITDDLRTARISWDIIHPVAQRKGVGSLLTNYRLNEIIKISTVEIVSVRTSQLVYPFYERFGLELREVVPDFWAKGFDMYRLDCKVTDLRIKIK
ncbi:GNAT family N-acetyltransferase [Dysgonomonas macrotermitis]|uniref:N-acetylglutamate synthase, GNAT family n=1 Tax=Dysgonomonas macrotermitis TaxID=1346286 RepID=A0A1M5DN47_9BACT|nr:GNAT family N-acetyltransferase [Dysgonomonas macrotermitis]SHF68429.1 N-acetylglutamate synthase, GNAT family [Dysgonomonas macrotermitis]